VLEIGDHVVFIRDGARGIIMEIKENLYHVIWEDHFASWEKGELLEKIEPLSKAD
jgi:hypothetical protein